MAYNEIYVDPSIDTDSGTGTSGDPYGRLQYALDNATRGGNGANNRFNVKAGTTTTLSAPLSMSTFGSGNVNEPCTIQGYTSSPGDGGIATIDGNGGNFHIFGATLSVDWYWQFEDMRLTNTGTAAVFGQYANYLMCTNCEISDGLETIVDSAASELFERCYIKGMSAGALTRVRVNHCFVRHGGTSAAITNNTDMVSTNNLILVESNVDGIYLNTPGTERVFNNSILCTAGGTLTNRGIQVYRPRTCNVINNLIEGFNSALLVNNYQFGANFRSNAAFDCVNIREDSFDCQFDDTETLISSPFAKTGSLPTDFTSTTFWSDVYAYFKPVDTGNVLNGFPEGSNTVKGALGKPDTFTYSLHPLAYN